MTEGFHPEDLTTVIHPGPFEESLAESRNLRAAPATPYGAG